MHDRDTVKPSAWPAIVLLCAASAGAACGASARQAEGDGPVAETVFLGDHIVTMDPAQPSVEAAAVRGETIAAAGPRHEVLALRGEATRVVELGERALLPGFIDAHGHFLAVGRSLDALSLHPPPVGDVRNIDDVVRKITAGKQADLVILAENPLLADPAELEHIEVVETFSRGRSVYAQRRVD